MGIFDKLKQFDQKIQEVREDLTSKANRAISGTDWPRPSDPDGIDVLAGVTLGQYPFRYRSDGAEASGWEFRERQLVDLYDTWEESKNKSRATGVVVAEILHRPYYSADELRLLHGPYGNVYFNPDPTELEPSSAHIPNLYDYGTIPGTEQPCILIWEKPAVIRISSYAYVGNDVTDDNRDVEHRPSLTRELAATVLRHVDRQALATWSETIEPLRQRWDDGQRPTGATAARGAINAVRNALGGEFNRSVQDVETPGAAHSHERQHDEARQRQISGDTGTDGGDAGDGGGLFGRLLTAAQEGAGNAVGHKLTRGISSRDDDRAARRGPVYDRAERPPRDPNAAALVPTLTEIAKPRKGDRREQIDDEALATIVAQQLVGDVEIAHQHSIPYADARYFRLTDGRQAMVAFISSAMLFDLYDEIDDPVAHGDALVGTTTDGFTGTTTALAIANGDVHASVVRLSEPRATDQAVAIAQAVAATLAG